MTANWSPIVLLRMRAYEDLVQDAAESRKEQQNREGAVRNGTFDQNRLPGRGKVRGPRGIVKEGRGSRARLTAVTHLKEAATAPSDLSLYAPTRRRSSAVWYTAAASSSSDCSSGLDAHELTRAKTSLSLPLRV